MGSGWDGVLGVGRRSVLCGAKHMWSSKGLFVSIDVGVAWKRSGRSLIWARRSGMGLWCRRAPP